MNHRATKSNPNFTEDVQLFFNNMYITLVSFSLLLQFLSCFKLKFQYVNIVLYNIFGILQFLDLRIVVASRWTRFYRSIIIQIILLMVSFLDLYQYEQLNQNAETQKYLNHILNQQKQSTLLIDNNNINFLNSEFKMMVGSNLN